jgi:hypothetical protein
MELWTSTHGGALLAATVLLPFVGMLKGAAGGAPLDITVPLLLPTQRRALPDFTRPIMATRSVPLALEDSTPLWSGSLRA